MAIELIPRARIQPAQSQTGGIQGRVEPMHDQSAGSMLAVGQGLSDLGRGVTVAADRMQDQVDAGMSLHLTGLYTEEDEKEMDAPGGFMTTVGQEASTERRKQHEERLRQTRQKLEAMAQNEAQKLNFKAHADHVDQRRASRANEHQFREARTFEAGERKAAADAGIREAIKFAGTEEGEVARHLAMQHYDKWAELTGMPPSMLKNEKQKATDEYHTGVLGRIVNDANNPPAARMYFEKHKGEMSPDAEAKAGAYVKRAGVLDTSMRAVDEMAGKGMTPDQMRRWAQTAFQSGSITAEEREAIEGRIGTQQRQAAQAAAVRENSVRAAAEKWLVDNPLASVQQLPPDVYRAIEASGQLGDLNSFAKSRRYTTDPQAFLTALRLPDDVWKSKTKEQVVRAFRGKLDDDDLKAVLQMHDAAMQPKYNKLSILSPEKMVEDSARRIGILPTDPETKPSDEQAQNYLAFRKDFNAQLDTWQDNHKKRAEEADVQKLLDARAAAYKQKVLVRESETTSGFSEFFGRALDALGGRPGRMDESFAEIELGKLTDAQQGRAFVRTGPDTVVAFKDIPEGQRKRIQEYIESKGQVATLATITDYWIRAGKPQ